MNEWYDSRKKPISDFRKLLQECLDKANPRRNELTREETAKLAKLESIATKLKRGENVQNRQLQSLLTEDEYAQIATEWDTQKLFREELKDKPSELKRYEDKLKEAIMMRNRSVAYHRKGKKAAAYKLDTKCESLCENSLEILLEIVAADTRLQIWFDRHVVYSIAKKYAREMLKLLSSNFEIDLMFGTNSHVMGPNDDKGSFLQKTLLKLIGNEKLEFTSGKQVFDVISVTDCSRAYKCIGINGKRNFEYWVGSGESRTLKEYVEIMANLYPSKQTLEFGKVVYNDVMLKYEDFSISLLEKDTDFSCSQSFEKTVAELYNWLEHRDLNE